MAVVAPLIEDKVTQRISTSMVANISTMLGLWAQYGLIYALEGLNDASNIEEQQDFQRALVPPC